MKLPDLTELALRNLRESLLRNSLTTIGISVGVASLVAMLSLGIGLQQLVSRRLVKSGLFDTVIVTSRRDMRGMGRERRAKIAARPTRVKAAFSTNRRESRSNICPTWSRLIPTFASVTELRYEDKPHLTMVSALPQSAKSNDAFDGMQGSFFSSDTAPEVILQKIVRRRIAGQDSASRRRRTQRRRPGEAVAGQGIDACVTRSVQASPNSARAPKRRMRRIPSDSNLAGAAYSVVSREQKAHDCRRR